MTCDIRPDMVVERDRNKERESEPIKVEGGSESGPHHSRVSVNGDH